VCSSDLTLVRGNVNRNASGLLFSILFVNIMVQRAADALEQISTQLKGEKSMNENESITVILTLDNDEELECAVLGIFEAGGREYIALLPMEDDGEDSQVYLYRYIDNGEEEEPRLENILDDDEFELASEAFNNWMDEQDFDDIDLDELD